MIEGIFGQISFFSGENQSFIAQSAFAFAER